MDDPSHPRIKKIYWPMKHEDARALEIIGATVLAIQTLFNVQILNGYYATYWTFVIAGAVVVFLFLILRNQEAFPVEIVGISLFLGYGFLRWFYSIGAQLPGKGVDVLLPINYSIGLAYSVATGAVTCLLLWFYRLATKQPKK
jgi:hypothetical protein